MDYDEHTHQSNCWDLGTQWQLYEVQAKSSATLLLEVTNLSERTWIVPQIPHYLMKDWKQRNQFTVGVNDHKHVDFVKSLQGF